MKRFLSILALSMLVVCSFNAGGVAATGYSVSGTVTLAESAPSEGLIVVLQLMTSSMNPVGDPHNPPTVQFSHNESAKDFAIPNVPAGVYNLSYFITRPDSDEMYAGPLQMFGFLGESGVVTDPMLARDINVTENMTELSFTIPLDGGGGGGVLPPPGGDEYTITGSITLPRTYDAQMQIEVSLLKNVTGPPQIVKSTYSTIEAGDLTGSFSVSAPAGEYLAQYRVQGIPHGPADIAWEGYYVVGGGYVNTPHAATPLFLTEVGLSGLGFTIPLVYPVGGNLVVPNAPHQGLVPVIIMSNSKTWGTSVSSFSVPLQSPAMGNNSFSLRVPQGSYYLYYEAKDSNEYYSPGYYVSNETTSADSSQAITLTVSTTGLSELTLEMLPDESGVPSIRYGDVNDDGTIDVEDAILIMRYVQGEHTLTEEQIVRADVNGDSGVSKADAELVLQYVMGLIARLPATP